MHLRASVAAAAVAVALFASSAAPTARAESSSCTVVSAFPASLSLPGRYCLDQNWTLGLTGSSAIYITAHDGDLDCNHHVVRTTAPAGNSAFGLQVVGADLRGVRVRNCAFDGFDYGLYVPTFTGGAHRLQDNRIVRAGSYGMFLAGNNILVEGNFVGTQRGGASTYPTGVFLTGEPDRAVGNVIRGNTFVDMQPVMPANAGSAAMQVRYQQGTVIEDNVISSIRSRTGAGTYGIITDHATELAVRRNTILSALAPGAPPFDGGNYSGIFLQGTGPEQATNTCVDNVVGHFNGNVTGCVSVDNTGL